MAKVKVTGLPGLDGEYDLVTMDRFTTAEWRTIKKHTGLRLGEFEDAFDKMDPDALVATAWVALTRHGIAGPAVWLAFDKVTPWDHIELEADETDEVPEDDDAGPPDEQPPDDENNSSSSGSEPTSLSNGSSASSAPWVSHRPPTGTAPSDTGQESVQVTSPS